MFCAPPLTRQAADRIKRNNERLKAAADAGVLRSRGAELAATAWWFVNSHHPAVPPDLSSACRRVCG